MSIQRILVVDDSDTDRLTLIRLLNKNGFETIEAINGRDGVNKAKELLPDLILMDVVMPELSGFEATRLITQDPTTKNIPVIICSSKGLKTDALWGKRQGAAEYIVKPISPNEVLTKIELFNKG
jgi:twitching motility two-component system response regulator PilH